MKISLPLIFTAPVIVVAAIAIWPMLDLIAYVSKVGQGQLDQKLKLEYASEFVDL